MLKRFSGLALAVAVVALGGCAGAPKPAVTPAPTCRDTARPSSARCVSIPGPKSRSRTRTATYWNASSTRRWVRWVVYEIIGGLKEYGHARNALRDWARDLKREIEGA